MIGLLIITWVSWKRGSGATRQPAGVGAAIAWTTTHRCTRTNDFSIEARRIDSIHRLVIRIREEIEPTAKAHTILCCPSA